MNAASFSSAQRRSFTAAGMGYFLSTVIPLLSTVLIFSRLVIEGNDAATVANIAANRTLFRFGVMCDLLMYLNNFFLSVSLYLLLKSVNENISLIALLSRMGDIILGSLSVVCALLVLRLIEGGGFAGAFSVEQLHGLSGMLLDLRYTLTSVTFVFLGVGAALFCYLLLKSSFLPPIPACFGIISFLLLILYAFLKILAPEFAGGFLVQIFFFVPSCLYEVGTGLWMMGSGLLSRSTRNEK